MKDTTEYPLDLLPDSAIIARLAPSLRASFVRLPANPATPLTAAQLDALFPPANRVMFARELAKLAAKREAEGAA